MAVTVEGVGRISKNRQTGLHAIQSVLRKLSKVRRVGLTILKCYEIQDAVQTISLRRYHEAPSIPVDGCFRRHGRSVRRPTHTYLSSAAIKCRYLIPTGLTTFNSLINNAKTTEHRIETRKRYIIKSQCNANGLPFDRPVPL